MKYIFKIVKTILLIVISPFIGLLYVTIISLPIIFLWSLLDLHNKSYVWGLNISFLSVVLGYYYIYYFNVIFNQDRDVSLISQRIIGSIISLKKEEKKRYEKIVNFPFNKFFIIGIITCIYLIVSILIRNILVSNDLNSIKNIIVRFINGDMTFLGIHIGFLLSVLHNKLPISRD